MRIRRAKRRDSSAIAGVIRRARAGMAYLPRNIHSTVQITAWIRDGVLAEDHVWVAEIEGRIVAFAARGGGFLNHLYVHPDHQGRGIGAALLDRAKAEAAAGLSLWTFEPNKRAIRFYERHGFVTCETTDGQGNQEKIPDRLMAWRP